MDRLLTQVRSRSTYFLLPTRHLSSFKPSSFQLKSRALLNLVNQFDASKTQTSPIPLSSNVDTTHELHSRFSLPGHTGFGLETKTLHKLDSSRWGQSLQEKSSLEQFENTSKVLSTTNDEESLSKLIRNNTNLEIRTYDCSPAVRSKLRPLFLSHDVSTQSLTAITIVLKTKSDMSKWSVEIENERNQLNEQFTKLAHEICTHLSRKHYWVEFIDPSNGKPYYGPPTTDALFETDERYRHFGINIVDLGCCRVIEHLQHGTHVFVGCIFTNTPRMDSNVERLLKESALF